MDGATYKYVRKQLRVTQGEVAESLGVTQAQISNIESTVNTVEEKYVAYLIDVSKRKNININEIISARHDDSEVRRIALPYNKSEIKSSEVINSYSKPYYVVDVFGSPGSEIIDDEEQYAKPKFFISIPEMEFVDMYIRVTGDSMYPKYRHGDIIGIKKMNSREFFAWYRPYVIITKGNYQRLLKYVHPHPTDKNMLHLVSEDSDKYPPQPIDMESVYEIWEVLGGVVF